MLSKQLKLSLSVGAITFSVYQLSIGFSFTSFNESIDSLFNLDLGPLPSAPVISNDEAVTFTLAQSHHADDIAIVPFRDEKTKLIAQKCVRAGYGGIFVKHFRKAGGTSLYRGIRRNGVCRQNKKIRSLHEVQSSSKSE